MRGSEKRQVETVVTLPLKALAQAVVRRLDARPPLRPDQEFEHRLGHAEIIDGDTGRMTLTFGEGERAWRMVLEQSDLRAMADGELLAVDLYECESPDCKRRFPRSPAFCVGCDMQPLDDEQLIDKLAATFLGTGARELTPAPPDVEGVDHARGFLDILLAKGQVELIEGADPGDLVPGLRQLLDTDASPYRRASAMIDWLLDRRIVDEVFASEDEIAGLIHAYW